MILLSLNEICIQYGKANLIILTANDFHNMCAHIFFSRPIALLKSSSLLLGVRFYSII